MSSRAESRGRVSRRRYVPAVVVATRNAPRLVDALLTDEQRAQSQYDVFFAPEQLARGRQLLRRGAWNLDGLSWENITELEKH